MMLQFESTWPAVPSWNHMFMLEAMTFKVTLTASANENISPNDVIAQVWTNLYHRGNAEGEWHAIDLDHVDTSVAKETADPEAEGHVKYTFSDSVILTSDGEAYRFTFRARLKDEEDWLWANGYMEDGVVKISPPTGEKWTKGPEFDHIIGSIYLGNFMASSVADDLGFDAILNVADNLDLVPSKFSRPIVYDKIPMADGARNRIPDHLIAKAVDRLCEHDENNRKTIVNCRAGIGRAGSTLVAYVFCKNSTWTFDDAYQYVFKRRFVYPHSGLRDTLYKLYPRRDK